MTGTQQGSDGRPDPSRMSREELVELGGELDGVRIVARGASQAQAHGDERRRRRRVGAVFALSILFGAAFVAVYVAWPDEYRPPGAPGYELYALYTPLLGVTFAGMLLSLGLGAIAYIRGFYPDEVSVQQVSHGPSSQTDRATAAATLLDSGEETGLGKRTATRRLLLGGIGVTGLVAGVVAVGGFVKNPWRGGDDAALWRTGWKPLGGETVYLRVATGDPEEIVRVRPEDMLPGSMQTVVPFRESERDSREARLEAAHAADAPVMLIRLPTGTPVVQAPGQEGFHVGDFYAFSKVCTHLGCPASLYDVRKNVAECPCHQSVFAMTEYARPIFGPATRPLPQLPIALDEAGYFVAVGDFSDPVGPGFWEVRAGMS